MRKPSPMIERVLRVLQATDAGPMTPTQIGVTLGIGVYSASAKVNYALKKLVADGLVIRVAKNSRNVKYAAVR